MPLYCDLLLQHSQNGDLNRFQDEVEFLNDAIETMVEREVQKGLFDRHSFENDGLNTWLETIATDYVEKQYTGFGSDEAEEYGECVLRDGLDEDTKRHILTSLLQFPLFKEGSESGRVAFVHDLVADAVAARRYLKLIRQQAQGVFQRLERVDVDNLDSPPLLRFMARGIDKDAEKALVAELSQPNKERGFAVALTLLMLARPGRDILRRAQISLEDRNLVGVRFTGLDLSRCSFRRSDLSYAVFDDCDLQAAAFQGAYFYRTRFEHKCVLRDVEMGNMERVKSILVGRPYLTTLIKSMNGSLLRRGLGFERDIARRLCNSCTCSASTLLH